MYAVPHNIPRSRPWLLALLWIGVAAAGIAWAV
jgi:hypothetical protein